MTITGITARPVSGQEEAVATIRAALHTGLRLEHSAEARSALDSLAAALAQTEQALEARTRDFMAAVQRNEEKDAALAQAQPTGEEAARLRTWVDDIQLSARTGFPTYANPSELKADIRAVLNMLAQARQVEEAARTLNDLLSSSPNLIAKQGWTEAVRELRRALARDEPRQP